MTYWVYILANTKYGTLYVGVTSALERRVSEHKSKLFRGFSAKHNVDRLMWHRSFGDVHQAIHFEKRLKRWRRKWKIELIEAQNPQWADLYPQLMQLGPLHPALRVPDSRCAASGMTGEI
jgi:putative endonuclease